MIRLLALLALLPATASAVTCADRDTLVRKLGDTHKEYPAATGVGTTGGLLEIIASKDGVTWTALWTNPQGIACVMATGTYWTNGGKKPGAEL